MQYPYSGGVSLESQSGVVVDNIPLREVPAPSSPREAGACWQMPIVPWGDMFILQFGGNVMPYIEDEQACINYGNWFASQIKYLKSIRPDAVFIVIGPSDMSTKIGTEYVTYPLLPNVRDALRKAALQSGAAYFDLFEAMGGRIPCRPGSMPILRWQRQTTPIFITWCQTHGRNVL